MAVDASQLCDENGEFSLQIDCFNTDPYEKKYFALLRRCENTQQSNERLVNRIHHVQRMLRRLRQERRLLMKRLDQHGDDYLSIPITFPAEAELQPLDFYSGTFSPTSGLNPGGLTNSSAIDGGLNLPSTSDLSISGSGDTRSAKKKSRTEKDTKKSSTVVQSSSNPYFLFSSPNQNNPVMLDHIKQEIKDEFVQDDFGNAFAENWNSLSDDKKQLFLMNIKQEKE